MEKTSSCNFLFAKDFQMMTSRWQGALHFRRYDRELVSKPMISLKKSWGCYRRTTLSLCAGFSSDSCTVGQQYNTNNENDAQGYNGA